MYAQQMQDVGFQLLPEAMIAPGMAPVDDRDAQLEADTLEAFA